MTEKAKLRDKIFPETGRVRQTLRKMNWIIKSIPYKINKIKRLLQIEGFETTKKIVQKRLKHEPKTPYETYLFFNEPNIIDLKNQRRTKFNVQPKISIIVPMYKTPIKFFKELVYSLEDQTYKNWELCLADGSPDRNKEIEKICKKNKKIKYKFLNNNLGIAGNTNAALELATGDYIGLLDHDDRLPIFSIYEVVKCINENPDVDFIYSDEDKFIDNFEPRYEPHFKPDFAPDTLRANNYICHFSVFKKELMDEIHGFNEGYDGAQDYDIILRATEKAKKIIHIPKVLYNWRVHKNSTAMSGEAKMYAFDAGVKAIDAHLKRVGLEGKASHSVNLGTYKIDYKIKGNPKVSILIPNKDGVDYLKVCINSILKLTTYSNYEIIIIENNSELRETLDYYKEIEQDERVRVIEYKEKGFNYSKIINFGVKEASGEYIIQLNNDTKLLTPNWIESMLMYTQRDDVGAVGVRLYYDDNTIQHAGIAVGVLGVAAHLFRGLPKGVHGYFARESLIQNVSAVTAACIMSRKSIYEEVRIYE